MSDREYEIGILAEDTREVLNMIPSETGAALHTLASVILHIASRLEVQQEGMAEDFIHAMEDLLDRAIAAPMWPAIVEKERAIWRSSQ